MQHTIRIRPDKIVNIYAQSGWSLDIREPLGQLGWWFTCGEPNAGPSVWVQDRPVQASRQREASRTCPVTGVHLVFKRAGCFVEVRGSGYASDGADTKRWKELITASKQ